MMWDRIVSWLLFAYVGFPLIAACTPGSRACESANTSSLDAWICSLIGSLLVGLSGVLPLLVIPVEAGASLRSEEGAKRLKQLLSFAIGGLLGDVFVHLLPEAWAYTCSATTGSSQSLQQQRLLGLWVIIGFFTFLILEKTFSNEKNEECTNNPAPSPKGVGEAVAWILPFTSGGFLYIALVNVLPDLLEEENTRNSLIQVLLISVGIVVMTALSLTVE
ncbi:hypothetical protein GDO78_003959 [Eleutherodactylus coqui]|nr:hypothetical protein GDO78_003959 [Eleutherodactylus coqui]KAG9475825.1 hypothetical protein GDO78_003959 [Eleutherodactylus coqui]